MLIIVAAPTNVAGFTGAQGVLSSKPRLRTIPLHTEEERNLSRQLRSTLVRFQSDLEVARQSLKRGFA